MRLPLLAFTLAAALGGPALADTTPAPTATPPAATAPVKARPALSTTVGTISAFDLKKLTLTLADGSVFRLNRHFKDPGLKVGEKVSVAWVQKGKHELARKVTIEQ